MSTGVENIQARVLEIEARFNVSDSTRPLTTDGGTFQDTLNAVLGVSSPDSTYETEATDLSSSPSGTQVVNDATQYLGVPYVWGGSDPQTGLDCSGLVQRVYGDLGISLPRVAADQARQGTAVASLAQAKPGDLVAFGQPVDHIGIYVGNNKMIVAPKKGDHVKIEDVYTTPTAIRRIIPDTTGGYSSASLGNYSSASLANFASASLGNNSSASMSLASLMNSYSSATSQASAFGNLSSGYNSLFSAAGAKYGISPTLLAAVAKQESGFNSHIVSGAGAQGLMQLMPSTAKSLGVDPLDPAEAIDGAARMLSNLMSKFGSTSLALAAYNAGPGAVEKYNGIPPYSETQNYVKNILSMTAQGGSI